MTSPPFNPSTASWHWLRALYGEWDNGASWYCLQCQTPVMWVGHSGRLAGWCPHGGASDPPASFPDGWGQFYAAQGFPDNEASWLNFRQDGNSVYPRRVTYREMQAWGKGHI